MIALARYMDNRRLNQLIEEAATVLEGQLGLWRIEYDEHVLFVVTDEIHNRMRVMTPIVDEDRLDEDDLRIVLAANFDRALDAKFAIANDYLWSVFTHPLKELTDDQFLDSLEQVKTLSENYGGSYASSELVFGGESDE